MKPDPSPGLHAPQAPGPFPLPLLTSLPHLAEPASLQPLRPPGDPLTPPVPSLPLRLCPASPCGSQVHRPAPPRRAPLPALSKGDPAPSTAPSAREPSECLVDLFPPPFIIHPQDCRFLEAGIVLLAGLGGHPSSTQHRLTKRDELSFLTVLAFPKASSSGLALMIWSSSVPWSRESGQEEPCVRVSADAPPPQLVPPLPPAFQPRAQPRHQHLTQPYRHVVFGSGWVS